LSTRARSTAGSRPADRGSRRDDLGHAVLRLVRFELRALLLTALAIGLVLAATPVAVPDAAAAAPRVVIIVGPAGSATDGYRADGERAAQVARAAGADVTTVYSPDATWPRVKAALQGASIVVYMGHGNGFPSPYGPVLRPTTKDGLGLNPVAGRDDVAHQYFGEAYLARDVRLAPHAVVLLHHLCYASGNAEPGKPEGDLATAQQRVDNMAAGWLAAGAEAVLAEAYDGPAPYVERILAGGATLEAIWRTGRTAHGHVIAFPSVRTPGMTALMDPTKASSGFYRSLVARAALRADEVAAGAALARGTGGSGEALASPSPSPRIGPTIEAVTLEGVPTAGSAVRVTLSLGDPGTEPVTSLGLGVRWDPLALDPAPMLAASPAPSLGPDGSPTPGDSLGPDASPAVADGAPAATSAPAPSAAPTPAPAPTPGSSASPSPAPSPAPSLPVSASERALALLQGAAGPSPSPLVAPPIVLISPETPGAVVALSDVAVDGSALVAPLTTPLEPGLYRLVVSVHDGDGVAFEAATQARIPALIVRVTGVLSALVSTTDRLAVAAGATVDLPVSVANTGALPWVAAPTDGNGPGSAADLAAGSWGSVLVGQWLRLDTPGATAEPIAARATIHPDPGASEQVSLALAAPADPGSYLLVLDVVSPLYGSLTAAGGAPVAVRVAVGPPSEGSTPTSSP
jgi:hypothetical protein